MQPGLYKGRLSLFVDSVVVVVVVVVIVIVVVVCGICCWYGGNSASRCLGAGSSSSNSQPHAPSPGFLAMFIERTRQLFSNRVDSAVSL